MEPRFREQQNTKKKKTTETIACRDKSINHKKERSGAWKKSQNRCSVISGYVLLCVCWTKTTKQAIHVCNHNNNNKNSNELWRMSAAATMASTKSLFKTSFTACFAVVRTFEHIFRFILVFRVEIILLNDETTNAAKAFANSNRTESNDKEAHKLFATFIFIFMCMCVFLFVCHEHIAQNSHCG